jgi:hypothetical protein
MSAMTVADLKPGVRFKLIDRQKLDSRLTEEKKDELLGVIFEIERLADPSLDKDDNGEPVQNRRQNLWLIKQVGSNEPPRLWCFDISDFIADLEIVP